MFHAVLTLLVRVCPFMLQWFAAEDVEFAGKVSGVGGLFARDSDSDSDSD